MSARQLIEATRSVVLVAVLAAAFTGCSTTEWHEEAAAVDGEVLARLGARPERDEDRETIRARVRDLLKAGLTDDAAVKIALLNNPNVVGSYERLGIARADLVQAGLLRNPVFAGDALFFDGGTEVGLSIAQSFLEVFFIPLRRNVAAAEMEAAEAAVTRDIVRLGADVRRSFALMTAAAQRVELRRRVLDAAVASSDLMQKLHAAGNVTDPQLTAEESAVARARLDLAVAEASAADSREPLNVLLGLWGGDVSWTASGRFSDDVLLGVDVEHAERRAVAASLELRELRAHLQATAAKAGLESWEGAFDRVSVGPGAKREVDGEWGVGPEVSLTLPLFDQGQAREARAWATLRQGLARQEALAIEIRAAARSFRDRLIAVRERVAYVKGVLLPLRSRLVQETLQNYNAMQIGAIELIHARTAEIEAGDEYIVTLRDAVLARLDLDELLAGSLNTDRFAAGAPRSGRESDAKEH